MPQTEENRIAEVTDLIGELDMIHAEMLSATASGLEKLHPDFRESGRNLLHYLALRRRDLRPLQVRLAALGLSSLGRAESHVLASVGAILERLHEMRGAHWCPESEPLIHFKDGQRLLDSHTNRLLDKIPRQRGVRIMVTMPSKAAEDYAFVHQLVDQGMDCMRINCAHDGPPVWERMIEHLQRASRTLGKPCRICMDLGGPKLRTGELEPGPSVVKIRPQRDKFGKVLSPARVWLTSRDGLSPAPSSSSATLPLPADWLATLQAGDCIRFTDARESSRKLKVVDVTPHGAWAELRKTAYLVPGTILKLDRTDAQAELGPLPAEEQAIRLFPGEELILTADPTPGRPSTFDSRGQVLTPASISCTLPEVFQDVRPGQPIWLNDGKIGGVIETAEPERLVVRITHTMPQGAKLRADKGINLPESELRLSALSDKDREDLVFAAEHADLIGLSFANRAEDVELLQEELSRLESRDLGIILKIETKRGFANLPGMLLTAMRSRCCGIMIARGDLAVECGFERLAEVQEEILWICEAAHVPVIWATQVLETLAKEGMPSRAEITDAAMSHRAECVMLNKGPHIMKAVEVLDNILCRMQAHQSKKQSMLRALRLALALPLTADPEPSESTDTERLENGEPADVP